MSYVKKSHTKLYFAIILLVILVVAVVGAIIYVNMTAPEPVVVGVKVGDTFTYSIKGVVELTGLNAVMSPNFNQYNDTDYFKVTITDVNGSIVSMDTLWRFKNGTEVTSPQTIDLSNGEKSDEYGFWALYRANLNIGDKLRPTGYDETAVNDTDTRTFTSGDREICFWFINNQFYDVSDPTQSTLMYDYRNIYFDRATGIMTSFTNYAFYNNPEKNEFILWTLTDTSVWEV